MPLDIKPLRIMALLPIVSKGAGMESLEAFWAAVREACCTADCEHVQVSQGPDLYRALAGMTRYYMFMQRWDNSTFLGGSLGVALFTGTGGVSRSAKSEATNRPRLPTAAAALGEGGCCALSAAAALAAGVLTSALLRSAALSSTAGGLAATELALVLGSLWSSALALFVSLSCLASPCVAPSLPQRDILRDS